MIVKSSGASGETAYGEQTGINHVKIGRIVVPTDRSGRMWPHFTADTPERTVPAWHLFASDIDNSAIEGSMVVIGTSAAGLRDVRATPLNPVAPHRRPGSCASAGTDASRLPPQAPRLGVRRGHRIHPLPWHRADHAAAPVRRIVVCRYRRSDRWRGRRILLVLVLGAALAARPRLPIRRHLVGLLVRLPAQFPPHRIGEAANPRRFQPVSLTHPRRAARRSAGTAGARWRDAGHDPAVR